MWFQVYGGNSFLIRLYRVFFESRRYLYDMWRGNPVLTSVLFGLPLGFLSLIVYSIFCADILDANEEDEEGLLFIVAIFEILQTFSQFLPSFFQMSMKRMSKMVTRSRTFNNETISSQNYVYLCFRQCVNVQEH